jgi:glycosyltransferase involved in cell wall biosynthesis
VIIPVWNSPELIAKCLTALAAQSYPRDRYEVVAVDNGSTDSTADIARSYPSLPFFPNRSRAPIERAIAA